MNTDLPPPSIAPSGTLPLRLPGATYSLTFRDGLPHELRGEGREVTDVQYDTKEGRRALHGTFRVTGIWRYSNPGIVILKPVNEQSIFEYLK